MVQDLVVACVEKRFGSLKTFHAAEWLLDNGSTYIANTTWNTVTALDLRLSILSDASTVLELLSTWFDDYNTIHPHSVLRF